MRKAIAIRYTSICLISLSLPRLLIGAITVSQPYRGITRIVRSETSPRNELMNIFEIDLNDPGIQFKLSPPTPPNPNTFGSETSVQTTIGYLNQEHAQLAFNVHFFDNPPQGNGGTNLTGFAASMGTVFSAFDPAPVLNYAILPNAPVLNIDSGNHATIAQRGATDTSLEVGGSPLTAFNSLSGSAQIITDGAVSLPTGIPPRPGTGVNGVPPVFFYTDQIAARTAVGLSQDENTLFFFTVDAASGRQGMTISEMAGILRNDYGVFNALNLDGGSSTTAAMLDPISGIASVVNGSLGTQRAVGTSLAIFAVPEPGTVGLVLVAVLIFASPRRARNIKGLAVVGIALMLAQGSANAAVVPYTQDFQSITVGGSLPGEVIGTATATTNTWAVVDNAGNHVYQNTTTATGSGSAKGFSSLQFTNLGPATPANSFEVSTIVSPLSVSLGGTVNYTAGLRLLGNTGTSTDDSYLADLNIGVNGGRMRLVEFTGATAVVLPSPTQSLQPLVPNFSISKSYLLDVLGTYDPSNALTLKFTVTEVSAPLNTQSYTMTADATPRTGQNFGFYDSIGSGGGTMTVNYDNLTVVPEPMGVLGGVLVLLGLRRGRKGQARHSLI